MQASSLFMSWEIPGQLHLSDASLLGIGMLLDDTI
jgi:hypothetical protein